MKFNVSIKEFEKAVALASAAAQTKGDRTVLSCLKIEANCGGSGCDPEILITGTDLKSMITVRIVAESVDAAGVCVVPARLLRDSVAGLGSGGIFPNVEVVLEESGLKLSSSSGENVNLNIGTLEDFPPLMTERNGKSTITLSAAEAKALFGAVIIAVDIGSGIHTGTVCLKLADTLQLVATDARRLALAKSSEVDHVPETLQGKYLIPHAAVSRLLTMIEGEERVSIGKVSEMLVFTTDHAILATRLFDGRFPDPERVLPKEFEKTTFSSRSFDRALDVVSPIAALSNGMTTFGFKRTDVEVSASALVGGKCRSSFPLDAPRLNHDGDEKAFEIAFNIKFLRDFLKVSKEEKIEARLCGKNRPALFVPPDSKIGFQYLVMPMTLG